MSLLMRVLWGAAVASMLGCASPTTQPQGAAPEAQNRTSAAEEQQWKPVALPGKRATAYQFLDRDGVRVLQADADGSASMMRRPLSIASKDLAEVSWSWWVDGTIPEADLSDVDRTDSPARLMFAFDGDKSKLSPKARMMFELARALTGEEPPYATLSYAFCTRTPVGSVLHNPRTERIRKIVVDSGAGHTRQWRHHRRNLADDFQKAFGETPGRLIGVAVMTDADNTRSTAKTWYGPIQVHARSDPGKL